MAENFPERCLYIAINSEVKGRQAYSGKYYFHSLYKNVGAYIREPGSVPGYSSSQFFLVYDGGVWYITNDEERYCFLWGKGGGFFKFETKETNPLLLRKDWQESDDNNGWSRKATVKIFANEEQYNNFRNQHANN